MKRFLIAASIVAISLLTPKAHAQDVIDGKHWHSVTSTNGKITIPEHSVITYVGAVVDNAIGIPIRLGNIPYPFTRFGGVEGNFHFSGELYTGAQPLEIVIEKEKENRESVINVSYYN